ncbi:MAG: hypothetical protein IPH91_06980 [Elusimicrobia bacterium]|nr:hypothetical protein [Elusimicrobiota bacterium]
MLDWLAVILSPIVGAGSGSLFSRLLSGKGRPPAREKPPRASSGVGERVDDLEEWRERAETLLGAHEREFRRLSGEIRSTRVLLDVFLVLLLVACATGFWLLR